MSKRPASRSGTAMSALARERCVACRPNSPCVAQREAETLLEDLPGWEIVVVDGIEQLVGAFKCKDFAAALAFANRVGELAEAADHHPRIVVEWGRVSVAWWTHAIGGLHRNDFIMAARSAQAWQSP